MGLFFLLGQYVLTQNQNQTFLRTVRCRVSGVGSNLGEACREVRDQFRGPFIKGMSAGGSLTVGSRVDLETRSASGRMESAAEISQAGH